MKILKLEILAKSFLISLLIIGIVSIFNCSKESPTTPEMPQSGSIQVNSSPIGAQVFLDGEDTGEVTNCILTNVAPGNHNLELVLEGYVDNEVSVTVSAGQTADVYITFGKHTIRITSPSANTIWNKGDKIEIRWEVSDTATSQNVLGDMEILIITNVKIELYLGNSPVRTIAGKAENNGEKEWTVPMNLEDSSKYRVRVSCASAPNVFGKSDTFEIREPCAIPTLISPERGALLDNGRTDRRDNIVWDFKWSNVRKATLYHLYIKKTGALYPAINTMTNKTSYHEVGKGSYIINANRLNWRWKVRALISGRWCDWSENRRFDVERVNTDPPSK